MNELWRLRRNGRVWAATALVGLATVVTVAVIAGSIVFSGDSPGPRDDTAAPAVQQNAFGRQYDGPGCREGEPGVPLVLLARLRAGHTLTELPGSVRALDGAEENLVVYWPGYNPIPLSDLPDTSTRTLLPSLRRHTARSPPQPAAASCLPARVLSASASSSGSIIRLPSTPSSASTLKGKARSVMI